MKKTLPIVLVLLLMATSWCVFGGEAPKSAEAVKPAKPPKATVSRPRRPPRRRPAMGPDEMMYMRVPRSKALEMARRYFSGSPDTSKAHEKLGAAYDEEGRKAMIKLVQDLNKKYAALIAESMKPEDREKYEKVLAAEQEYDDTVTAARSKVSELVQNIRKEQGRQDTSWPTRSLTPKLQPIINACFKLSDEQSKQFNQLRRKRAQNIRNLTNSIKAPKDRKDYKAQREYWRKRQELRKQAEQEGEEALKLILTDEQKKACEDLVKAMEERDKQIQEAGKSYEEKLDEIIGREEGGAPSMPSPRPPRPVIRPRKDGP